MRDIHETVLNSMKIKRVSIISIFLTTHSMYSSFPLLLQIFSLYLFSLSHKFHCEIPIFMHTHTHPDFLLFFIGLSFSLLPLTPFTALHLSPLLSLSSLCSTLIFFLSFTPHIYFTTLIESKMIQNAHLHIMPLHTNICADYI